jgi:predicted RNA-binding protein with PUA-like domain
MRVGELVLVYHSNAQPSGVVGLAKVIGVAEPDESQFDPSSEYFDPKATIDNPRWFAPLIEFVAEFPALISLDVLRKEADKLAGLALLQRGSRLSVIPVAESHFKFISEMHHRLG